MAAPVTPVPLGEEGQTTRPQAVADYAAFLSSTFTPTLATEWTEFAALPQYAKETAFNTLHAFAVYMSGEAVGQSASAVVSALGKLTEQEVQGTGAGLGQTTKDLSPLSSVEAFLGLISSRAFIVRAVQVIAGLVLVVVGLAQLSGLSGKLPEVIPV